mmetsp:Transcript_34123/g.96699  ORF Transcript_34123/g.96699 Transcript_34123/m.96699 type:complete len:232 (+) Transcript_34123:739-1434(+)|eukprot:CAMPEP_0117677976 /NCGR_PEP_ID=MMETSP0804-20121206/17032_1 /TAXON_ID=1074897 /ORGANISM="Tetraselmis astigmatica, Strain CCMP880" /LENGTH=231 /DNA_ID=CAMNT_0005487295 /DNA_START=671 /DNA_END=1366 /DNA_ORIENTATION=+
MPGELPHTAQLSEEERAAINGAIKRASQLKPFSDYQQPALCSFLQPSQHFQGVQRVAHSGASPTDEDWYVNVSIITSDFKAATVFGTMEAENVPHTRSPVTTFWEGEIVDNIRNTFYTAKWGASADNDMKHWSKFPSFLEIKDDVRKFNGRCQALSTYPFIFMRWKEKYFLNASHESGLTIAGFYYVCLNRLTGTIMGYYYDPNSSPFQKLELHQKPQGTAGHSFADFALL